MDIDKEREAFEKWVTNQGKGPEMAQKLSGGEGYAVMATYLYWQAWQARAELEDSINIQVEKKKC